MINEYFLNLDDFEDDDVESATFDIETVKYNINTYSSTKLCEMIVCDRYFGCYKEIAIHCMNELATRRANGDIFDFENNIEQAYNELPKLDLSIPDIRDILSKITNGKLK